MTSKTELIKEIRKEFLSTIKNPDVSSRELYDSLDMAIKQTPDLLNDYSPGPTKDTPSSDKIDWSATYFSRHVLLAEYNFARERIEHLIKVREYLREQGVKGFLPSPCSSFNSQVRSPQNIMLNYEPAEQLKNYVEEGDLLSIRTTLQMEFNNNSLNSENLRAAVIWVKTRVPDLFDTYAEKAFAHSIESNRKHWDSQYYDKQIVYLNTNFSEERFLHLIEVRDLLRQQGVEGFAPVSSKPRASTRQVSSPMDPEQGRSGPSHSNNASPSQPGKYLSLKAVLVVGGAVAALVILLITLINGQS